MTAPRLTPADPAEVRAQARRVLAGGAAAQDATTRLLELLLHPGADVTGRAAASTPAGADGFADTERGRIRDRVADGLTRRVAGGDPTSEAFLRLLADPARSPQAVAARTARSDARHAIRAVARDRSRRTPAGADMDAPGVVFAARQGLSAEDAMLQAGADGRAEDAWAVLEAGRADVPAARSEALRVMYGLPRLCVPRRRADRVRLAAMLDGQDAAAVLRSSLHPGRTPSDPSLAGLWGRFSPDDVEELLLLPDRVLVTFVCGAVRVPDRPPEQDLVDVRARLRALSDVPGWPTVVSRLVDAWAAVAFTATPRFDHRSDPAVAERRRARVADGWPSAVADAVAFPGTPLGAGVCTTSAAARMLGRVLAGVRAGRRAEAEEAVAA